MSSLGSLSLDLIAKTAPFERGMKRATAATALFSTKASGAARKGVGLLTGSIGRLNKVLGSTTGMLGLAGGAASLGALATFSIKAAANLEQTKAQFETMLGSAEKADEVVGRLFDFSKKTPFEPSDVFGAGRVLLAGGFEEQSLARNLQLIGDVAAVSGSRIKDLATIFSEIKTKGKADAGDFRQFTTRGINLMETLQTTLGKTSDEINDMRRDGKIGIGEVTKAFEELTKEGGIAFGAMERQSRTLNGLLSTLKGNVQSAFAQIGTGAVEGAKLKDVMVQVNKLISETNWRAIGDGLKNSLKPVIDLIVSIDAIATTSLVTFKALEAKTMRASIPMDELALMNPLLSAKERKELEGGIAVKKRRIKNIGGQSIKLMSDHAVRAKGLRDIRNADVNAQRQRTRERLRQREFLGPQNQFFAGAGAFSTFTPVFGPNMTAATGPNAPGRTLDRALMPEIAKGVADHFEPVAQAAVDVIQRGVLKAGGTEVGRGENTMPLLQEMIRALGRVERAIKDTRTQVAPRI